MRHFSRVAAELGIVIPVSFYEKEVNNTYNSVAVLDADGKNLGSLPENTYSRMTIIIGKILFHTGRYRL